MQGQRPALWSRGAEAPESPRPPRGDYETPEGPETNESGPSSPKTNESGPSSQGTMTTDSGLL